MARWKREPDDVLGERSLTEPFDVCIIGSGAGGGSAAHVLTAAGKTVLVLETGDNPFPGLDDPKALPFPLHSNDELKYSVRNFVQQDPFLEPRTFRADDTSPGDLLDDVNSLPKAVGGAFQHADCKTPRFNAVDFRLKSAVEELIAATPGLVVPGFNDPASPAANFADWPFTYDDLEPFYVEAERLHGTQGDADNIYESRRSRPYPTPAGVGMYLNLLIADAAKRVSVPGIGALNPHTYPAAITTRFARSYDSTAPDDRPPCVDCGLCSGFGCPNNSKGSPAVTTLRRPPRSAASASSAAPRASRSPRPAAATSRLASASEPSSRTRCATCRSASTCSGWSCRPRTPPSSGTTLTSTPASPTSTASRWRASPTRAILTSSPRAVSTSPT